MTAIATRSIPSKKIPPAEVDAFCAAATEAVRLARVGLVSQGCQLLLEGMEHAEGLRDNGAPWGEALADYYRRALALYVERCGLRTS
jgi:hypothetical protein